MAVSKVEILRGSGEVVATYNGRELKRTVYKHFKGGHYFVIGLAINQDFEEQYDVIYVPLYGERPMCSRDITAFLGTAKVEGKTVNRFEELTA